MKVLLKMKELHLIQKALAERMNCTQQYVSKILKGKENLSLDTMTKLEEALEISLVYPEVNAFQPSQVAEEVCVKTSIRKHQILREAQAQAELGVLWTGWRSDVCG